MPTCGMCGEEVNDMTMPKFGKCIIPAVVCRKCAKQMIKSTKKQMNKERITAFSQSIENRLCASASFGVFVIWCYNLQYPDYLNIWGKFAHVVVRTWYMIPITLFVGSALGAIQITFLSNGFRKHGIMTFDGFELYKDK